MIVSHFPSLDHIPVVYTWADGRFPRRWPGQKPASELLRHKRGTHRTWDFTFTAWWQGQRERVFSCTVGSGASVWGEPVSGQGGGEVVTGQRWRGWVGGGARDGTAPAVTLLYVQVPARRVQGVAGISDRDSTQPWRWGRVPSFEQSRRRRGGHGDCALHSTAHGIGLRLLIRLRWAIRQTRIALWVSVVGQMSCGAFGKAWDRSQVQLPFLRFSTWCL